MIIKSIEIKNFRQFKNTQKIEFSTSQNENITLILGDNTSGKTTLLQSFLWCFYGDANFKSKDALLNSIVGYEMIASGEDDEVKVSIELEHHGMVYYITRSLYHYVRNNEIKSSSVSIVEMSYKQNDGQSQQIPTTKVNQKIEEILPEDLSSYFLYDTERFGNVTTKSDVADAVKGILGLTVLENTISHIGKETQRGTLLGKLKASLNLKGNQDAEMALKKMQEAEEKKEELQNRKKEKSKEVEHYDTRKIQLEDVLRSLEASAKLQTKRDELQRSINYEKGFLESKNNQFQKNFKSNTFMYLAFPLMQKSLDELKNAQVDDKGIKDMNANSIKDIIQRGRCVCGTEVAEGNAAYNHLLDEINYLPPESIGNLIRGFKEKTQTMMAVTDSYFSNLKSNYQDVILSKNKIANFEEEIEDIKSKIKDQESVKKYQDDLSEVENKIKQLKELLANLDRLIWEQEKIIEDNQKTYNNNIGASEKNKEILTYMEYAQEVLNWVEKRYKSRESSIREQLEEKVNKYFSQIYHGKRKVEIDDKYRVTLITTSSEEDFITDESQGLETVKNFAFISGLVELAKEKLNDDNENHEKDSEDYPLVLDAPFSNADEKHVENISKVLPEVASQLILIVMSKDWNYAEKSMGKKVGMRYSLDKKSEVLTEIVKG